MDQDLPHKENLLMCMWASMMGKLDAQLVKLKLKKARNRMSCEEFVAIMQDVIDEETTAEELRLFQAQQQQCNGCSKRFELEQEMVEVIRKGLERKNSPRELEAMIRSKVIYSS